MLVIKSCHFDSYFWNSDIPLPDLNEKITTRHMEKSSNRQVWEALNANWKKFKHAEVTYLDRNNDCIMRRK